jgi:hypothetical protein
MVRTPLRKAGKHSLIVWQWPDFEHAFENPAVIDTLSGTVHYDNYGERWGKQEQLHLFLQAYVVEKAKSLTRQRGFRVREQQLQDGSIKLQIQKGA